MLASMDGGQKEAAIKEFEEEIFKLNKEMKEKEGLFSFQEQ